MVTTEVAVRFGELLIALRGGATVIGVPGDRAIEIDATLAAVRDWVSTDDAGRYRPLSGYRSLKRGWSVQCGPELGSDEALDVIYPLALRHRKAWDRGDLRVVLLDETLGRQSGRYALAAALSPRGRRIAAGVLCGGCVRTPVWRGDEPGRDAIPCPEACSVFVALCRETARWERGEHAQSAPTSEAVGFADFETPGNEIRESVLCALAREQQEAE